MLATANQTYQQYQSFKGEINYSLWNYSCQLGVLTKGLTHSVTTWVDVPEGYFILRIMDLGSSKFLKSVFTKPLSRVAQYQRNKVFDIEKQNLRPTLMLTYRIITITVKLGKGALFCKWGLENSQIWSKAERWSETSFTTYQISKYVDKRSRIDIFYGWRIWWLSITPGFTSFSLEGRQLIYSLAIVNLMSVWWKKDRT